MSRDLTIYLVRHGESEGNVGNYDAQLSGDFAIPVTERGKNQAKATGIGLTEVLNDDDSLVYCSPYLRTQETLHYLKIGANASDDLRVYEDPRLREMDFGYGNVAEQKKKRRVHGWFYYRYEGGESPADCYDRVSGFIDSMMRQVERKGKKKIVIVTHGLSIRCFVTRFLHLTVAEYEKMANPDNARVIKIRRRIEGDDYPFMSSNWVAEGLEVRHDR